MYLWILSLIFSLAISLMIYNIHTLSSWPQFIKETKLQFDKSFLRSIHLACYSFINRSLLILSLHSGEVGLVLLSVFWPT